MRILITGGTGFVGSIVLREALRRGHEVLAMTHRSGIPQGLAESSGLETMRFDLGSDERLDLNAYKLDGVIHAAASLGEGIGPARRSIVNGSRQLAESAAAARIGKFVLISSVSVVDFAACSAMGVIDESSPRLAPERRNHDYAALKFEQESVVEDCLYEGAFRLVILRPGLVYDAHRLSDAHAGIAGKRMTLFARHGGRVPLVDVCNVAVSAVDAVELDGTSKAVYHLLDDCLPTQSEYIQLLRDRAQSGGAKLVISWRVFQLGSVFCRFLFGLLGITGSLPDILSRQGFARRLKPFRFSNARAKRAFKRDFPGSILG